MCSYEKSQEHTDTTAAVLIVLLVGEKELYYSSYSKVEWRKKTGKLKLFLATQQVVVLGVTKYLLVVFYNLGC